MIQLPTLPQIEAALQLKIQIGGREREVRLWLQTVGNELDIVSESEFRSEKQLPAIVLGAIDTIDGEPPSYDEAVEIVADRTALGRVVGTRMALLRELSLMGRMYALCPHCEERESSFDLMTLALVLGAEPPPLVDKTGIFRESPSLADAKPLGKRLVDLPGSSRLRGLLPTGRIGLEPQAHEAILRDLDTKEDDAYARETAAWDRWAPLGNTPPEEHSHWFRGSPGFRAILRLTVALVRLDDKTDLTPEQIEGLSIVDFHFIDALYYLTHSVDQPRPDALVVTCERCGGAYLPLR